MNRFNDATEGEIQVVMERAWTAFRQYREFSIRRRAVFMRAIAEQIDMLGDELIRIAMQETNLGYERLAGEKKRTVFQLTSYADACEKGDFLQVRIDTADSERIPPKPDIRKTRIGLGPVVVFGASNFPFAYSTGGGDTACAFAAGCPVVVKAHPAHPETSKLVADAITKAAAITGMPDFIFQHIYGASIEVGKALVMHPKTKAVGFTGSFTGGKALFDWANQRQEPIPVFSEMGSVNPVFLLPGMLQASAEEVASMYASSVTLSVGQFCTNPGLLIGISCAGLKRFKQVLSEKIAAITPQTMLHPGIARAFVTRKDAALNEPRVHVLATSATEAKDNQGLPTIATVDAPTFLNNPRLHEEVFGPYSLLVECESQEQMLQVAECLEGQLTSTLIATTDEAAAHKELISIITEKCGRFIMNGVPTGVEVCLAMHHGGPFPATTDSRFTAVGADGINRFTRPVAFQNWPEELLPEELKTGNVLRISRTVNNVATGDSHI